jgi:hydroxypyruvate isomerase
MPRFAANVSFLFQEKPFLERFAAAAACGFKGVEFTFPYHHPAEVLGDAIASNGLKCALFNAPPGDWAAGERGLAALPKREEDFRDSFEIALEYAELLDAPLIHVMAGIVDDTQIDAAFDTYCNNLEWAAKEAAELGLKITIEPINAMDMPGYFLTRPEDAMLVLQEVNSKTLKLQYDLYHAQITQGGISDFIESNLPDIAHIQVAGVPGRNEPDDQNELNYAFLFNLLDAHGYGGWIGCEYQPRMSTEIGLRWARSWGIGAPAASQ